MFPDAEDAPAFLAEENSGGAIAAHVPFDFSVPIFFVAGRHAAVFGAAVPKAAVHEDREAFFREDEIGAAGDVGVTAPPFEFGGAEE